jgi:cytidylate kinase
MKTRVICVSRTLGARGEEVAQALSQRLGFRYIDEEIIAGVADKEGVDVQLVQDAERRQTFIERLLESFAVAPAPEVMAISPGLLHPAAFATGLEMSGGGATLRGTEHYRQLIRDVVRDTAKQGEVVIVAHAAAMALAGQEGVLRVLVTASPDVRAKRLAEARKVSAADAEEMIKDSDKSRREYFKTFYDVREEQPVHYDFVVNSDVLSVDQIVEAVVTAARR